MANLGCVGPDINGDGTVTVTFEGNWATLARALQPVLVDADYRQTSSEVYHPSKGEVIQSHRGTAGVKFVRRTPNGIVVNRNGVADTSLESSHAAALVADAYIVFTFGCSALRERGSSWQILDRRAPLGRGVQATGGAQSCRGLHGQQFRGLPFDEDEHLIALRADREPLESEQFHYARLPGTLHRRGLVSRPCQGRQYSARIEDPRRGHVGFSSRRC